MIKAEIILDTRYKSKNGYNVKIRILQKGLKKYEYVGTDFYTDSKKLKVTRDIANRIEQLENEVDYCNELGLDLKESVKIISDGIKSNRDKEIQYHKQKLNELTYGSGIGLREFNRTVIEEKKINQMSIKAFVELERELSYYLEDDIYINDITYEWLNGFILYKKKLGTKEAGISYYLRTMRSVYKEAQRRESLNIKQNNPFLGLITTTRLKEPEIIPPEELKKLFDFKPKYGTTKKSSYLMQRNIDLFLFQFAIGGHDYADVASMTWDMIKEGRLEFKRYKNRNKPNGGVQVSNVLNDFSLGVIERYGTKKDDRIFSFIPMPSHDEVKAKKYNNYTTNILRSLKSISDSLELSITLRTKTPRYLFRSYAGELFISDVIIGQLQGHKLQGVSFRYQSKIPKEVIDKEHLKVLDLVF